MELFHNLIDLHNERIYPARIYIEEGYIKRIEETKEDCQHYALPGFIDAHIHIESSMLVPSAFARIAVQHGTIATVSDPHEIANVCGIEGVEYMLANAKKVPFHFFFGAPSCVPATSFETAGATLNAQDVKTLLDREDIYYLSEMMNWPGVLNKDAEVMQKIKYAQQVGKCIDGHAPGLKGEQAKAYASVGISSDHECFTKEEALDKLDSGMHILIREGSAAKNFEALIELLPEYSDWIMFCCDDKHPDELILHHIDHHIKRALAKGMDLYQVLRAACINPIKHYKLPIGQLKVGDAADFIVVDSPAKLNVHQTFIKGEKVFDQGKCLMTSIEVEPINHFNCQAITKDDIKVSAQKGPIRVIKALDGEIITESFEATLKTQDGHILSDIQHDILKLVVVNRYKQAKPAVAFINGFGLDKGAIASTVAHDCHNIVCVGTNDQDIVRAINILIEHKGGVSVANGTEVDILPLPIAGLMSTLSAEETAKAYSRLDQAAKDLGSTLSAPFMTLSFMALLVIPELKLSDLGLFDGQNFKFVALQNT